MFPSTSQLASGRWEGPKSTPVQILLPHEILHCLSECGSSFLFDSVMLGHMDDASRVEFWEHVSKLPPWKDHPALKDNSIPWDKLVGMTIHADGAAFHRDDEYFVYSITSVFRSMYGFNKDVLLTKIPLCVIPERQLKGKQVAYLLAWFYRFMLSFSFPFVFLPFII